MASSSFLFSVLSLDRRPSRDWPVVSSLRVSLFGHTSYPSPDTLCCSLILVHPLGQHRGSSCSQTLGRGADRRGLADSQGLDICSLAPASSLLGHLPPPHIGILGCSLACLIFRTTQDSLNPRGPCVCTQAWQSVHMPVDVLGRGGLQTFACSLLIWLTEILLS